MKDLELDPEFKHPYAHYCTANLPYSAYGVALDSCYEDTEARLWVSNGEYMSQVNFCPFCGYEAKIKVEYKE